MAQKTLLDPEPKASDGAALVPTLNRGGEIAGLLRLAIEKGRSADDMTALIDLVRREREDQARERYNLAIAAFQLECPIITKKRSADRYKFAAYEDIMPVCQPLLVKHGIGVQFSSPSTTDRFDLNMTARVGSHSEVFPFSAPMPDLGKIAAFQKITEPQAYGVVNSYFKRYHFCNTFNIVVAGEDNDAAKLHLIDPLTEAQVKDLRAKIAAKGASEARLCTYAKVERLEDIAQAKLGEILGMLNRK